MQTFLKLPMACLSVTETEGHLLVEMHTYEPGGTNLVYKVLKDDDSTTFFKEGEQYQVIFQR